MSNGSLEWQLWTETYRATVIHALGCANTRKDIAAWMGIGLSSLAAFLNGAELREDIRGKVAAWCDLFGLVAAWPEQAALALLVADLPVADRQRAREELTVWIRERLAARGAVVPEWIQEELDAHHLLNRTKNRGRGGAR